MKSLIFSIFLFLLIGCSDKMPKDVLEPQAFQNIQWDLMRADEMVEFYRATDTNYPAEKKRLEYYNQILLLHQVSQQQLNKTIDYYTAHPVQLRKIIDSLEAMGQRLQRQKSDTAPTPRIIIDTTIINKAVADTLLRNKFLKRKAD